MRILIAGDFCPKSRVQEAFDKSDYTALEAMQPLIAQADYSIVNFECPVVEGGTARPIKKCGPCLKTTSHAVAALKYAGFDCVTLANNHFRDFGDEGCNTTIEQLKKANIDYVGGGRNISEAQQVLYKQLGDKMVAIVNFCENEFSIATDSQAGSAPLDLVDNYHQITEARKKADRVLVIVHGGHELYQLPSPRMKKLYRHFVTLGADTVINHHQHCYSGYEYFEGKPIVYGLGNFCFDWNNGRQSIWNEGYCVVVDIDSFEIELIPYTQCKDQASVVPMIESDRSKFFSHIAELNAIIIDDKLLKIEFGKWVDYNTNSKLTTFAPYCHRYLNIAANKKLIPVKLSATLAGAILNHVACESHRDITIEVMSHRMNK